MATRADEVHRASRERDRTGNGAKASEPYVTVPHLRRTYTYMNETFGPGDNVEIPRGLAITLGLTFPEADSRPATDVSREAAPVPNAPEPEVDDDGKAVGAIPSAVDASIEAAARHDERVAEEEIRRAQETGEGVHEAFAHRLEPGETMAQPGRLDHALASGADDGSDNEDMLHGDQSFRASGGKSSGGAKNTLGGEGSPGVSAAERNKGLYDLRAEGRGGKAAKAGKAKRKGGAKGKKGARKGAKKKKGARKKAAAKTASE